MEEKFKKPEGNGGYQRPFSKDGSSGGQRPFSKDGSGGGRVFVPKFIMLVGLPGSGKTYYARSIVGRHTVLVQSHVYSEKFYHGGNCDRDVAFKVMTKRALRYLRKGKSVIFDATNVVVEHRLKILAALEGVKCEKLCVVMATPIDQCVKWDALTDTPVSEKVIRRMMLRWCTPCLDEGWDKITVNRPCSDGAVGKDYLLSLCDSRIREYFMKETVGFEQACNLALDRVSGDFVSKLGVVMHYVGVAHSQKVNAKGEVIQRPANNVAAYYSLLLSLPINPLRLSAALSYCDVDRLCGDRADFVKNRIVDPELQRILQSVGEAVVGVGSILDSDPESVQTTHSVRKFIEHIREGQSHRQFVTLMKN